MQASNTVEEIGLLSIHAVAAITGRSYSWVRDRTIDGTLAYVLDGRRRYVPAASLAAYLRAYPIRRPPQLRLVIDNT